MREERSALVAYHYFDFNDTSKRHIRGLLASLLSQLSDDSDACRDVLHELFKTCRDGSERPSDAALVNVSGPCSNAQEHRFLSLQTLWMSVRVPPERRLPETRF